MEDNSAEWISFSDIMTTLMLVFLLISLLVIKPIQAEKEEIENPIVQFAQVREAIYQDLKRRFADKEDTLGISITKDLTIKFTNADTLFDQNSTTLKQQFREKLNEFLPIYFSVINDKKYANDIKEIRIEGHTANYSDAYNTDIRLVELSQGRSNTILRYIIQDNQYYADLNQEDQDKIFFWLSATGFGKNRAVDDSGELVYFSQDEIAASSRRIEFKIITTQDELIDKIININN